MTRGLNSNTVSALTSRDIRFGIFVKMEFDSGDLNLWSGIGDKVLNGDTYLGVGELLGLEPASETTEVRAEGAKVSLSGIPSSNISTALGEDYQNRFITITIATLDSSDQIIDDPFIAFKGRMDQMQISEKGETSVITILCESQLIDLKRTRERRYTDQDQKIDYPNDRGLEFVNELQNKEITFGPDTSGESESNTVAYVLVEQRTRTKPNYGPQGTYQGQTEYTINVFERVGSQEDLPSDPSKFAVFEEQEATGLRRNQREYYGLDPVTGRERVGGEAQIDFDNDIIQDNE